MRVFLKKLGVFIVIHLAIWSIIVALYVRQKPFELEFAAAINDKERLLQNQPSPRLIIVGGSNTLFGIDSSQLRTQTQYYPVNMGLNIGDGLGFMLKHTSRGIKRGDVVIVSPEYEHFGEFYNGKGEFLFAEAEHRPSVIVSSFTAANFREVVNRGFIVAGNVLRYTVDGKGKIFRAYFEDEKSVYRRRAVNEYGDLIGHYGSPMRLDATKLVNGPTRSNVTDATIARAIQGLNLFSLECEKKGARVFYSFAPVPREGFAMHGSVMRRIEAKLREQLGFPILDSPEEMSFPLDNFFDGFYHLTYEGAQLRTNKLIQGLTEKGVVNATQVDAQLRSH